MSTPPRVEFPFDLPLWFCALEPRSRVSIRTRADIEQQVVARALRDPEYRRSLVAEPIRALEVMVGARIPSSLTVEVLEDTPTLAHLAIPHNPFEGKPLGHWTLEELAVWVVDGRRMLNLDQVEARQLVVRAWGSGSAKSQLLNDPSSLLGASEPYGCEVSIRVHFETESRIFVVLPDLSGYHPEERGWPGFVSVVNQPLVIGSQGPPLCTIKTTESPYGCGTH